MKTLIVFYSTFGHIHQMAKAAAEGAEKIAGNEVSLRRIRETLPMELLQEIGAVEAQKAFASVPEVSLEDLTDADAIIWGLPTRFGGIPSQVQQFIDTTGPLWVQGALVGKMAGVFVGTGSQHGGQETTIRHMHTMLLHHGFVIAGLPYSFQGQTTVDEVAGGSPYGATVIGGPDGSRRPNRIELDGARFQGEFIAGLAAKLTA